METAIKGLFTGLATVGIILFFVLIVKTVSTRNEPTITYDSVSLHIQYKGCVISDKFEEDGTYKLVLTSKYWRLKNQYKEITVSQHIYTNLYFIGDAIK